MTAFSNRRRVEQETWRRNSLENQQLGRQNGRDYFHILPRHEWELSLFQSLRTGGSDSLSRYLESEGIKAHSGIHNLCSSWILCANLYFPFRNGAGREVLASFLRAKLGIDVHTCDKVHLEYEHPDPSLKPGVLLGEDAGSRGSGQTSPDLAFEITTSGGPGLILVESKFTEHGFYRCSGYKADTSSPTSRTFPLNREDIRTRSLRVRNPDPSRCRRFQEVVASPATMCHAQQAWNRHYWNILQPILDKNAAAAVVSCPAATGAYQLLRQQALAEALASSGRFTLVVSAVAYDSENRDLFRWRDVEDTSNSVTRRSRSANDLKDLRYEWPRLFAGKARFATFAHQDWIAHVRSTTGGTYAEWLSFVGSRYGFTTATV